MPGRGAGLGPALLLGALIALPGAAQESAGEGGSDPGTHAAVTPAAGAADALAAGDYAAAAAAAREHLRTAPEDAGAWQVLGEALAARGATQDAAQAYRRALDAGDDTALPAAVALARLRLYGDERVAALQELRELLRAHEADVSTLDTRSLRALGRAAELLAAQDAALHRRAVRLYQSAIERDPGELAARVALGDLLLRKYNNTEALELYREALAIEPRYAPALLGLARSHHFDHSPGAADAVQQALSVQPTLVPARALLARLLLERQDFDGAAAALREGREINPRDTGLAELQAALHFLRGEEGLLEAALGELRTHAPHYAGAHATLAEVAERSRRYDEAVAFARAALDIDAQHWDALASLGFNRLRLGEMDAGRRALERAFAGDPFNVRVKNTLDLLDILGDYAVERSPRFVLVAEPGRAQILAPYLLPLAEAAFDHYAERYGYAPPTPVRIEVYSRHEDFSVRTVGLVGLDILGASFGPVVLLDTPSGGPFGAFNWASALWHELAHTFHLGLSRHRAPRWFSEGLAVHEERRARPGWGADVSPDFLVAFEQGRLRPASELEQAFLQPRYGGEVVHSYFLASLLIELIEERHGVATLAAMLRRYGEGANTPALVSDLLGYEPAAFDAALEQFVRTKFARPLRGLSAAPGAGPGEAAQSYEHLHGSGRQALEAGEPERAESLLLQAQRLVPEFAGPNSTYHDLARLYQERGDIDAAIAQLRRNIDIDADDLAAHLRLAALLREGGEPVAAREVLQRSVLIEPFAAPSHAALGELLEQAGDWAQALGPRRAVLALEPEDEIGARFHLARALSRAGQPDAARRELLRTLLDAPLYEDALELLLQVRAQLDENAAAETPATGNEQPAAGG